MITKLTKFNFSEMKQDIQLRVSFFDAALDTHSSPITYSQEICVNATSPQSETILIPTNKLPCLYTANNTSALVKQSRLIMLIWACGPDENFPREEMLLGQVNIKMGKLKSDNDVHLLDALQKVCLANYQIGQAHIVIQYSSL